MTRARIELVRLLVFASFATFGAPARAEPVRASLVVTRDDGARECPDSAALGARVDTVAGKDLFDESPSERSETWVQVEFVRAIAGFRAVISTRGSRQGTRSLEDVGPDCTSLADAVAVTLAILLDPPAAPTNEAATRPSVVVVPPAPARRIDTPPRLQPQPSKSEATAPSFELGIEASGGASLDVSHGLAPLAEAGVRARVGELAAFAAGAGIVFPARVEFVGGAIDVSLTYGSVRGCVNLLPHRSTTLEACLEPLAGALRGAGKNYDETYVRWVFWSAAAAVVQAYGPISESVLWSFRARVLAPFARHGFSVEEGRGTKEAFRLSGVGASLAVGLEVEL